MWCGFTMSVYLFMQGDDKFQKDVFSLQLTGI